MGKSRATVYETLVVQAAPSTFSSAASRCDTLLAVRQRVGAMIAELIPLVLHRLEDSLVMTSAVRPM